jgi:hypothetical protein
MSTAYLLASTSELIVPASTTAKLSFDCMSKVEGTSYIWSKTSCVAAATCESPSSIVTLARCNGTEPKTNPTVADQDQTPALSTNIYKNIVGSCADQGCPMTQQNYVDFVYGALSAINSTDYPDVGTVINTWWGDMKTWTNTGDSIPYKNFNDFLHYDKA